jgi:hypothetical protein
MPNKVQKIQNERELNQVVDTKASYFRRYFRDTAIERVFRL